MNEKAMDCGTLQFMAFLGLFIRGLFRIPVLREKMFHCIILPEDIEKEHCADCPGGASCVRDSRGTRQGRKDVGMKRRVALLMAAVLILGAGFSSYATEADGLQNSQEAAADSAENEAPGESAGTTDKSGTDTGESAAGNRTAADGGQTGADKQEGATGSGNGSQPGTNPSDAVTGSGNGSQPGTNPSDAVTGSGNGSQPGTDPSDAVTGSGNGSQPGTDPSDAVTGSGNAVLPGGVTGSGNGSLTGQPETEDPDEGSEPGDARQTGPTGQVDVSIGAALILGKNVTFRAVLKDAAGNPCGKEGFCEINLTGKNGNVPETGVARFKGLAEGKYTLIVSAEGFATYTQEIAVESGRERVELMTGFLNVYGMRYTAGTNHPGVLLIGDVNGDGLVNEGDRAVLMEAIEGDGIVSHPRADLNGDGVVDLVDLEYLTKGFKGDRDILSYIESTVSPAAMELTLKPGTQVESGNPKELLENDMPLTLKNQKGVISKDSPVELAFDVKAADKDAMSDGLVIETGEDTNITSASFQIEYVDEDGKSYTRDIPVEERVRFLLEDENVKADWDKNGNIEVHLGRQVAIKRVILTIMAVKDGAGNSVNLAEISKVEFVNGMENRIPEPEMNIPKNLSPTVGSSRISLSWDPEDNITGYEVEISQVQSGLAPETVMVPKNALDIVSFGGKELVNYQEYQVRVQSVNGTWRSGYCESMTATPQPSGKPDKPDDVSAAGDYQSIKVSWKKMKDTRSYNLYYKKTSEGEYQKIEGITANSYTITGLPDATEYTVYVTSVNEYGESGPSLSAGAVTFDSYPAVVPKYGMINLDQEGKHSAHIVSASLGGGSMEQSPLDKESTAWGTVDNNASSYYYKGTWDDGGFNYMGASHGLTYEFDQAYKMDTFAFHDDTSRDTGYFYAKVRCWGEDGNLIEGMDNRSVSISRKSDQSGRVYYVMKLPEPKEIKKIQFGLAQYGVQGNRIAVSEVYFYKYDTLWADIMGLYEDDLHTVLRSEVTQKDIDDLRTRINTVDPVSGEYHPDQELLELELSTAEAILNDAKLLDSVEVHGGITTKDVNRGFGGLNAWQPLGVSAAAGEEIIVYVGHNSKKTGENAGLQLVATQYHSEAAAVSQVVGALKVGPNKITVPKISSTTGVEAGGALYVQYTGDGGANDRYAVRVSGGVQVPGLDLYRVTDEAERLRRATAYVEALDTFVGQMENKHAEVHQNSGNAHVNYAYAEADCILGASDILLDTMMLSLPAKQLLAGTGTGTAKERAERLLTSMKSVEDEMYLFYQHKGLNETAPEAKNKIPKGHLNIRYQRMFSGAFMYASGNHIGIEWGSATGLVSSPGLVAGEDGRYVSGYLFGWGIAHEIGHCINQGTYAVAEVTNNYFAVLAQAKDSNDSVRFQYANVYDKVTSGTKGPASNVFTRLGMYWQLHLAYDRGYNYKTYENYEEQLANLFFARVDTYARDTAKAPSPGGVALKLAGDTDQNLMRLSCAAAQKDILEFFERWGMTPNEETRAYAAQFAKETRAIYYVCDDSRVYTLQGGESKLGTTGSVDAVGDAVTAVVNSADANRVDFTLSSKGIPADDVLGYEIVRCFYSGGKVQRETAGFATGQTAAFSDRVYMNNRVVWYEITVIDQYLNRSKVKVLDPVKIEHDGSLDKSFWTVSTNGLTVKDAPVGSGDDNDPCAPGPENVAERVIDGDVSTVYTATAGSGAEIILEFNKTLTVAGFKYQTGAGMDGNYKVQVLSDGVWIDAASGSFGGKTGETIHFANPDGKYVSTYAAAAVKLTFSGQSSISVAELDVLGITGDNVDFRRTQDSTAAIGKLAEDYRYGTEAKDVIPAGSIVFTGSYKGNPAYNAVLLFDQEGEIVGGTDADGNLNAQFIILADVPAQGNIQNVSDGTWIYWMEDGGESTLLGISKVRAELYRVNNALTNEGQRLVSDSLFEAVPTYDELPAIRFSGGGIVQE